MLKLVTPPAATVVSLADAKRHLRVLHDDDDGYIQALTGTAIGLIDGADGWLGRALGEQTWEFRLDRFPCTDANNRAGRLVIPLAPLISVDMLEYTGSDGAGASITGFRPFGIGSTQPGYILPAIGNSWPSTICEPEVVRITFKAGYEDLPVGIKHAVLLMVGHWYENREAVTQAKLSDLPMAVEALLMPHRNWRG